MLATIVSCVAFAQAANVTEKIGACSLKEALARISKDTGTHLEAAPEMGTLEFLIDVKDVALKDLTDRIAKVSCGRWLDMGGGGWKLTFDSEAARQRQLADLAARTKRIVAAQKKIAARLEKAPVFGPVQAETLVGKLHLTDEAMDDQSNHDFNPSTAFEDAPAQRAMYRAVLALDPQELAGLGDQQTVFSDRPTSLQRKLPDAARSVIAQLVKEQGVWCSVFKGDPQFDKRPTKYTADPRNYTAPLDANDLRIIVKIAPTNGSFQLPFITVWFVDHKLTVVAFGETTLDDSTPPQKKPAAAASPEPPLTLSAASEEFLGPFSEKPGASGIPAKWKEVVLNPDKHDPRSYGLTEILNEAAEAKGENLVACLSDDSFRLPIYAHERDGKLCTASRLWRYGDYCSLGSQKEGNWRTVWDTSAHRANYATLSTLLHAMDAKGQMRLDDIAVYAASEDTGDLPGIARTYMEAVLPASTNRLYWEWPNLRFFGLLTPAQREIGHKGGTFAVREVPADAKAMLLHHLVTNSNVRLTVRLPNGRPDYGMSINLHDEPTELLAGGISGDGTISAGSSNERSVLVMMKDETYTGSRDAMNLEELAMQLLIPSMPQLKVYDRWQGSEAQGYVPGWMDNLTLTIQLTPTVSYELTLSDLAIDLRAKGTPLTSLPQDFLDEFAKHTAEVKRQRVQGENPPATGPPPP